MTVPQPHRVGAVLPSHNVPSTSVCACPYWPLSSACIYRPTFLHHLDERPGWVQGQELQAAVAEAARNKER